jgi:hypothetical protein
VVHSSFFSMGFRSFLLLTLVPAAVAVAASCAPIQITDTADLPSPGGVGGAFVTNMAAKTSGAGTGGGAFGADAGPETLGMGPLTYLCGGSAPPCSPDPTSEDCTPGGNAGLGGAVASDAAALACQLVGGVDGQVAAMCGMAGTTAEGLQCNRTSDCQAGLGCVVVEGVSVCRTYCCESLESCAEGTYCAQVPLAEASKNNIPVCVPEVHCTLLGGTCLNGQTCAIVRASGATSCVPPGPGTAGQTCPCAAGYTCSWTDNTCLELCETTAVDPCGPDALCQGGTLPYPSGVGYCVSLE